MAKLFVLMNVLLVLLAVSCSSIKGEQPTYTDCRPHIDATIRDLASKAVQAGEEPSAPEDLSYGDQEPLAESEGVTTAPPTISDEARWKHKAESKEMEEKTASHFKPELISVKDTLKAKRKKEAAHKKHHHTHQNKHSKNKTHSSRSKNLPKSSSKVDKSRKSRKFSHGKKLVKEDKPKSKVAETVSSPNIESPLSPESTPAPEETPTTPEFHEPKVTTSAPAASESKSERKVKLGLFNRFVYVVFGIDTHPRDPKYAKPWKTHKEFAMLAKSEDRPKPSVQEIKGPGMISRFINKCVDVLFGIEDNLERDSKWATSWQTHKEYAKREEKNAIKAIPKASEKKSFFNFNFFNKFVAMVFGEVSTARDPKFAQPWTTHHEFKSLLSAKKEKDIPETTTPKPVVVPSKRGIVDRFLSLIFELPTGDRGPKWAQPWKSHKEFIRKSTEKKEETEKPKPVVTTSRIGDMINKFVYMLFEKPAEERGSKWNEPWTTHKEHIHLATAKGAKTPDPVAVPVDLRPGFISRLINSAVAFTFGQYPEKRDPKWSRPWQDHREVEAPRKKHAAKKASHKSHKHAHVEVPSPPVKSVPKVKEPLPAPTQAKQEDTKPSVQKPAPEKESFPSSSTDDKAARTQEPPPSRVADVPKAPVKQVLDQVAPQTKKVETIEDEEEIVLVPSSTRSRDHISSILGLDDAASYVSTRTDPIADATLKELKKIYEGSIQPLEKTFKYKDISNRHLSDAELFGTPHVLLLGPYSTGKSTFINYLLGTEFTKRAIKTGTPPSHGIFRIVQYGDHDRELDGTDIGGQWTFASLQKFGQNFVDQIRGNALNEPLLKKVTFIEAPGILEMRRPNERLYPFNDVLQWFIDRADLILIMFDYTKLDAGFEMEAILDQLKGREAQTRILLNKADQVPPEELIKVQGSLFWNLSPLLGVSSPPTVYAGSFTTRPYRLSSPVKLFQAQEEALLHDIAKCLSSRVDNRIAIARRHAVRVRNHAQMVDTYLNTFYRNKGFLTSKHKLADDIIENPHDYNIYEGISLQTNVSRYDLPDAEVYRDFFRIHNLYEFKSLSETCGFLGGCPMKKLDAAISVQLPELMTKYRRLMEVATHGPQFPDPSISPGEIGARNVHAHAGKS